jgi:plasmid replication initiation protein
MCFNVFIYCDLINMPREVITKANALIQASYRLSLNEMQILLYGVSLINPLVKEFPLEYKIDIKDFSDKFGKDLKSCYREVKESVINKMWERDFSYEIGDDKVYKRRFLTDIIYGDKEGYIKICFHPKVAPYLHQLSQKFTVYYIDQIAKLKSIYSVRFYEFMIMEINKAQSNEHEFILAVEEIKERLEIKNKYKKYNNLKAKVLTRAKTEINEHSDLLIDFEEIKQGRTVESIKFIVRRKEGTQPARYQRIEEEPHKPISINQLPSAEEMAQDFAKDSLKERLINFGVTESVANNLVNKHSAGFIEKHIDYTMSRLREGAVTNPAAYVVSLLNDKFNNNQNNQILV